jgi:DNA-directed RNA polymerase specialized sigma24 family protein
MRLGFDDVGGDDLVQEVFLALTRRLPDVTSEEVLQVEGGKPERDEVRRR